MPEPTYGPSGLPRDAEEFALLMHSRTLDKAKETRKVSIEMPLELSDRITALAADLGLSRSDIVNYLLRQSGESIHWLREYVSRPKESAE